MNDLEAEIREEGQRTARLHRAANAEHQATPAPGHVALSEEQKVLMARVRRARAMFVRLLQELGDTTGMGSETEPKMGSANLTLALRHIEDAEYRAVRHITGGPR